MPPTVVNLIAACLPNASEPRKREIILVPPLKGTQMSSGKWGL